MRPYIALLGCLWLPPLAAVAAPGPVPGPAPPAPAAAPTAALHLERGFIDDPYALAPDGSALYFIATDGATWAELRRAALPPAQPAPPVPPAPLASELLGRAPLSATALHLLPGDRLLIVYSAQRDQERSQAPSIEHVGEAPEVQVVQASVFSLTRRAFTKEHLGPAGAIALARIADTPAVVAFSAPAPDQPDKARPSSVQAYRLQAVSAATFRPLGAHDYRLLHDSDSDSTRVQTPGGPGALLFPFGGYLRLAVKLDGPFDRQADIRRPDRLGFLDALTGKEVAAAPIADPAPLLELAAIRDHHRGESAFLHIDPAEGQVQLFPPPELKDPPAGRRIQVTLQRKLSRYDQASLRYQVGTDGPDGPASRTLLFSLTVDPVNPDAVARRKAEPDDIDLSAVDLATGKARPLRTLAGQGRPTSWIMSGSRLCLLRKHKGFSRGGTTMEVYDLPAPR